MITKDNLITKLLENFTEFKEKMDYEKDELLPYNIIGDFSLDFQKQYLESNLTEAEIDKFFEFINQMANSNDKEIQNILIVEVFEVFSDKDETIKLAKRKLNNKGTQMLDRTLIGWRQ